MGGTGQAKTGPSWALGALGILFLTLTGLMGCGQRLYVTEQDFKQFQCLPFKNADKLEEPPNVPSRVSTSAPSSVLAPEARERLIGLSECIAIALENGRTNSQLDQISGLTDADKGSASNATDSIRVFAFEPAMKHAAIEESLAKFDMRFRSSMEWSKSVDPLTSILDSVISVVGGKVNVIKNDNATFKSELFKPMPTGGVAGLTFQNDYQLANIPGNVNPTYTPRLKFSFEQPLLQGAGVAINQVADVHPGGVLAQFPTESRVPGILLTRIAYNQSKSDFERRVQDLLLAVEKAYWELECAYWDLYSREVAMQVAHRAWQIAKLRYQGGKIPIQDLANLEEQYQSFRVQRLQVLGKGSSRSGVLEAERRLRYVLGLPSDDGTRLVPLDVPTVAPFQPSWELGLANAMGLRAELVQAREAVKASQLAVLRERNFLLPDLRAYSNYDIHDVGSKLDGSGPLNAWRNLAHNHFNNWTLGLRMEMPIGFRQAHGETRRAQLRLAQNMAFLRDQECKVEFVLKRTYRELVQYAEEMRMQHARRKAAAQQLQARYAVFVEGEGDVDVLTEAQRNWADALRDEHVAICNYNIALADWERQQGTLMARDNVHIAEGGLPSFAEAEASKKIQQMEEARILRQRPPDPGNRLLSPASTISSISAVVEVPDSGDVSVPALLDRRKYLGDLPDNLRQTPALDSPREGTPIAPAPRPLPAPAALPPRQP